MRVDFWEFGMKYLTILVFCFFISCDDDPVYKIYGDSASGAADSDIALDEDAALSEDGLTSDLDSHVTDECSENGVEAYFKLNGNFEDECGNYTLARASEGGFDESGDYFNRGLHKGASTKEWLEFELANGATVEGWVRFHDNDHGGFLFGFPVNQAGVRGMGFVDVNSYIRFYVGSNNSDFKNDFGFPDSYRFYGNDSNICWHYIAAVIPKERDKNIVIFRNGSDTKSLIRVESTFSADEYLEKTDAPFFIGRYSDDHASRPDTSNIDEVRLWNRALTDDEIEKNFEKGLDQDEPICGQD